jgi:hypothetical protein
MLQVEMNSELKYELDTRARGATSTFQSSPEAGNVATAAGKTNASALYTETQNQW